MLCLGVYLYAGNITPIKARHAPLTEKQNSVEAAGATRLLEGWPKLGLNHGTTSKPCPRKSLKIK